MPKTYLHICIDSEKHYTPEQRQALTKAIEEKIDLLTGASAAHIKIDCISPQFTEVMRYAQGVITLHLPGQYPDLMRYMEAASIATQRDFHRMTQNWESEMQSAKRRAAREPWRHL